MPKRKKSSDGMPKRKKSSEGMPKRKNSSEGQDYISNLPDFIIGHILSFLSTKDAVRTSVLSKRWIYTWTFVTKLCLCDGENSYPHSYKSIKQFSNFVSRVLFHINSASIQSFDLSMGAEYDSDLINRWLSAVLKKGVKIIWVESFNNYDLSFYPLFQSSFLEKLVLKMKVGCIFKVSTFVCLPSLTSLSFVGITFTRYSSDKLNELTLKLPLLRNYSTTDCTWLGVKSITFEAPLLEQVNMSYSTPRRRSRTEIKFCASHLKLFVYQGYISSETIVVDGYIASAIISLPILKDTSVENTWVSFRRFLSFFTNTECLQLILSHLRCPTQVEHHLAGYPAFQMLGHMRLNSVTGGVLLSLLLKSPCLKTLALQMDKSDEETQNFAIVPDCFLSTLKVVEIQSFSGSEGELSFAKFVMENARVLERINFTFLWRLPSSELEKAKEKLFSFEKSRSTLIMEFSPYGN